jgi:UDP-N-acetylmuramyl tripeptide synthase
VSYLAAQLRHGSVVVSGTNGKTTTTGLTAYVLKAAGLRVWRNREGANLVRGVTAALVIRSQPTGRLRWHGNAAAVFEVDEAAFLQAVAELRPRIVAITNLFRDQLDRYGEVDTVAAHWRVALRTLPASTTLVLNADDPTVAALADATQASRVVYFGVEAAPPGTTATPASQPAPAGTSEVVDTRTCPRCHGVLTFSSRFYSHIGHWSCPACGFTRPRPALRAAGVEAEGLDATRFTLITPEGTRPLRVGLPGLYNVYNALAAAAVGHVVGAELSHIGAGLERFMPAFGRAERIAVGERDVRLLLAKNPTGLNEVLRALGSVGLAPRLLLVLNDRPADGEDVSWIWDADFERIGALQPSYVLAGGTRAFDLALRLKYAGVVVDGIEPDIACALSSALAGTAAGQTLYIVPTFTAMLAVRAELERRGYAPHYWEQRDV